MSAPASLLSSALAQPWLMTGLAVLALICTAWLVDWLSRHVLLRAIRRLVEATPTRWDDALLARGVISRLAHVAPALAIYFGVAIIPGLPDALTQISRNLAAAYVVLTLAQAIAALLGGIDDIYRSHNSERARNRPIKGYIQITKIVVYTIAGILIIATLIERSPLLLLSGLGAMTAVLLLVFRDTILSLVASVQLSGNDMVRVGDWIEMPKYGADGDVIDVALHTVKVQNWDRTITTIPTHALIADSFRNWRGMSESGGRRIKRALHIDQNAIRHLDDHERDALERFVLLRPYLAEKRRQLADWNRRHQGQAPVNLRRLTNVGTFRAYAEAYLRAHPRIRTDATLLVRHLAPGPDGLPIELYCFTDTTAWADYESIQADLFDHLLAIAPEFDLRLFQSPSGNDMGQAAARIASAMAPGTAEAVRT
ncbi:MAG TPA: mechanosensitive ion channel protein MscS [Xanthomonadales bacterium]|nr:mechanosensitive ion channel protein MscS [Xanthomonadales bacterium]